MSHGAESAAQKNKSTENEDMKRNVFNTPDTCHIADNLLHNAALEFSF